MRRPLYGQEGEEQVQFPESPCQTAHMGLWYDKFCDRWTLEGIFWVLGKNKEKWTQRVAGERGDKEQIEDAITRFRRLVESRSGSLLPMKTTSRFVTGLGRSHPVENGFAWHPTLGTAYLPGSSVKGMVRAWAQECGVEETEIQRLLGTESKVGEWIFFDALPLKPICLEVDIMTPHYGDYYADPKQNPPHDRSNPIPIPFLTVAEEQEFVFAFAPRRIQEKQESDEEKLSSWLKGALDWMGAGAKTAVGYGRFTTNKDKENEWKKEQEERQRQEEEQRKLAEIQRERAKLPMPYREMVEDGYEEDTNRFMEAMTIKWLPRLEEPGEEKRFEIAEYLMKWYKNHMLYVEEAQQEK
ncbi:type III-B CRISPR module RAMP protein Cmr6 [Kroppenstedtia pulmonis]|uniref:Type III-B CRISPR module RAMP protein Cmr6 n=1 Tax=Kroppenstedtia pulmonis TaxID=1380685 RepID=A0A7D3Y842_9BACL|nr:type III-B CRISPR module RAMP protein Cmr6 [Kroppenstedtia pulmonis]QKG83301.1 type III-B CRISPR module RAMP protein Cmr6 [Kroppenstedtia pulmonis]